MSWLTIVGFIFLAMLVFVGATIYDEGRRDLRHGIDGHPKLIAGVCVAVLAAIGAVSLLILAFSG